MKSSGSESGGSGGTTQIRVEATISSGEKRNKGHASQEIETASLKGRREWSPVHLPARLSTHEGDDGGGRGRGSGVARPPLGPRGGRLEDLVSSAIEGRRFFRRDAVASMRLRLRAMGR